jgi:predicted ATP-dependent Lon-type protease
MAKDFVVRNGLKSLGGITFPLTGISVTYLVKEEDYLIDVTGNTVTVTLPTAVGVNGKNYVIKNRGTGVVTVATTSSQTIDGANTKSLNNNDSIEVISDGNNWIIAAGTGTATSSTTAKSGIVSNTTWTGTPLNYQVSFTSAFPNTNYSVTVTGGDARVWTVESVTVNGFIINSNSNTGLLYPTYWIATLNVS